VCSATGPRRKLRLHHQPPAHRLQRHPVPGRLRTENHPDDDGITTRHFDVTDEEREGELELSYDPSELEIVNVLRNSSRIGEKAYAFAKNEDGEWTVYDEDCRPIFRVRE
jgi:hypothetical protein